MREEQQQGEGVPPSGSGSSLIVLAPSALRANRFDPSRARAQGPTDWKRCPWCEKMFRAYSWERLCIKCNPIYRTP